jgi:hypothetical protein
MSEEMTARPGKTYNDFVADLEETFVEMEILQGKDGMIATADLITERFSLEEVRNMLLSLQRLQAVLTLAITPGPSDESADQGVDAEADSAQNRVH